VNQAVVADVAKGASVSGSVERRTQKSRIARIAQIHKTRINAILLTEFLKEHRKVLEQQQEIDCLRRS